MRINQINIENFFSFREAEFNLRKYKGITLVEGRQRNSGAASNGSGKSALFEAIVWGIFGKTLRRLDNVDDVRYRFDDSPASVSVEMEFSTGRRITIHRTRGKSGPNLTVSGLQGSGVSLQPSLEHMIGFDYDLFTRSVVFGGELSAFCRMGDSERKAMLEELLGITYFEKARELARVRADQISRVTQEAENDITHCNEVIVSTKELLRKSQEDVEEHMKQVKSSMNEARDEVSKLSMRYHEQADTVSSLRKQVATEEEEYKSAMDEHKSVLGKKREDAEAALLTLREREKDLARCENTISSLESDLEKTKKKSHPSICPTCKRDWPDNTKINPEYARGLEKEIAKEEEKKVKCRSEVFKEDAYVTAIEKEIRALSDNPPKKGDTMRSLDAAESSLTSEESLLKSAKRRLKELENSANDNRLAENVRRLEKVIDEKVKEKKEIEESIVQDSQTLSMLEYWKRGFSKQGIPFLLLDSTIPALNDSVEKYSHIMTDGQFNIAFDPSTVVRGKETFGIRVVNSDGAESYLALSKGEKTRVDLCVLLSIRSLMAGRMQEGFEQMFVDEVFDGLDEVGVERVMTLVRKALKGTDVFIITQDPGLKGMADNSVVINKKGNTSQIAS